MAMMKALVRYGREPEAYAIREMPIPVIGPDKVLVEVACADIFGTDTVIFRREDHSFIKILIQGHELSGTIVSVGDRVAPESNAQSYGTCPMCLADWHNLCPISSASATVSTASSPVTPSVIGEHWTACPKV